MQRNKNHLDRLNNWRNEICEDLYRVLGNGVPRENCFESGCERCSESLCLLIAQRFKELTNIDPNDLLEEDFFYEMVDYCGEEWGNDEYILKQVKFLVESYVESCHELEHLDENEKKQLNKSEKQLQIINKALAKID